MEVVEPSHAGGTNTIGLGFEDGTKPVIVYAYQSEELKRQSAYAYEIRIARQVAVDEWQVESTTSDDHAPGNIGIAPVLVLKDDKLHDVFHFSNYGYYWVRSTVDPNGKWSRAWVGRQGDGLVNSSLANENGFSVLFHPQRMLHDASPWHLVSWDGGKLERIQLPLFPNPRLIGELQRRPVLLTSEVSGNGWRKNEIRILNADRSFDRIRVPANHVIPGAHTADADSVVVAARDGQSSVLMLLRWHKNDWTSRVIGKLDQLPLGGGLKRLADGSYVLVVASEDSTKATTSYRVFRGLAD